MSPLDQFIEVNVIINITKSSIIMSVFILLIIVFISNKSKILEAVNDTIMSTLTTLKYAPILISLTLLVLVINLSGNVPYGYAITSSIIVCLGLSVSLWLSSLLLIIYRYKYKTLSFFVPNGTPLILVPLLVLIELVSFVSRSLSLGVRLFSNIVAGHTLIHLISSFIYNTLSLLTIVPFVVFLALVGLELAVSFIQCYVLLLLVSSYLEDSLYLH